MYKIMQKNVNNMLAIGPLTFLTFVNCTNLSILPYDNQ